MKISFMGLTIDPWLTCVTCCVCFPARPWLYSPPAPLTCPFMPQKWFKEFLIHSPWTLAYILHIYFFYISHLAQRENLLWDGDDENQSTIRGRIGGWPRPETAPERRDHPRNFCSKNICTYTQFFFIRNVVTPQLVLFLNFFRKFD